MLHARGTASEQLWHGYRRWQSKSSDSSDFVSHLALQLLAEALLACHKNSGGKFALKQFVAGRNRLENEGAQALSKAFEVDSHASETFSSTVVSLSLDHRYSGSDPSSSEWYPSAGHRSVDDRFRAQSEPARDRFER